MAETSERKPAGIAISARAFISTIAIILGLMVAAGILTYVVPAGHYLHTSEAGVDRVVPGSFAYAPRPDYPVWRWFTAPAEVLWSPGNVQVITIIILLVLIGGSFTVLDGSGILKVALSLVVERFKNNKYGLMAAIIFFFMFASSVLGIYEEAAPLVVFIVPLALYLGWDSLTGLGMSLLALGFGFAAATMDPFMITIAQSLSGLPLYSGLWLRAIFFAVMFGLVFLFVSRHARKVEADPRARSRPTRAPRSSSRKTRGCAPPSTYRQPSRAPSSPLLPRCGARYAGSGSGSWAQSSSSSSRRVSLCSATQA